MIYSSAHNKVIQLMLKPPLCPVVAIGDAVLKMRLINYRRCNEKCYIEFRAKSEAK